MSRVDTGRATRVPPPLFLLMGVASVQVGNAWADMLFHRVGAGGAAFARLAGAMVILMVLYRPALRGRSREEWRAAGALGLVLAGMNLTFYHAIARLPLGIAVTVEFIGPLTVAVAHSRRRRDAVWVLLAAAGILALAHGGHHHLSPLGLILAATAGGLWGIYIPIQARVGRAFADGSGLALAMAVAAVVGIPDGLIEGGSALFSLHVLVVGLAVALLSSVIPYSVELQVLRRMPPGVFGVLMSMEPGMAALAAAVILGQGLSLREVLGMALVTAASVGASLTGGQPSASLNSAPLSSAPPSGSLNSAPPSGSLSGAPPSAAVP